jgi:arginyl-tRNA--protein-N-Asp/Glu arginylyltransferase
MLAGMQADPSMLRVFQTAAHPCGYWPDRSARDLVLDPGDPRVPAAYGQALARGFRRSGDILYRPGCEACRACVPLRIAVDQFRPDRSQRRCLARNRDIQARVTPAGHTTERFALYRRYVRARHAGGGMDTMDRAGFAQFVVGSWTDSRFLELRLDGRLVAVAVTDLVEGALSAVYTFFDPRLASRSLGTLAILEQLAWARREGRRHLYLGYWIPGHEKMDYKQRFRPFERFDGRGWSPTHAGAPR